MFDSHLLLGSCRVRSQVSNENDRLTLLLRLRSLDIEVAHLCLNSLRPSTWTSPNQKQQLPKSDIMHSDIVPRYWMPIRTQLFFCLLVFSKVLTFRWLVNASLLQDAQQNNWQDDLTTKDIHKFIHFRIGPSCNICTPKTIAMELASGWLLLDMAQEIDLQDVSTKELPCKYNDYRIPYQIKSICSTISDEFNRNKYCRSSWNAWGPLGLHFNEINQESMPCNSLTHFLASSGFS